MNLYGYANGDPLNNSDPFGLCVFWIKWCPPRDAHYARNERNGPPPSLVERNDPTTGWRLAGAVESVWHRQGDGNEGNRKYVNTVTGSEAVFDEGDALITDPLNQGSFNVCPGTSALQRICHVFADVLPYLVWGNTADDPSTRFSRTVGEPARQGGRAALQEVSRTLDEWRAAGVRITVRQ